VSFSTEAELVRPLTEARRARQVEGGKGSPLTLSLSPMGRGKFLLPSGEKGRMRGKRKRIMPLR